MIEGSEAGSDYLFVYGTLHPSHAPEELADLVRRFDCIGQGSVAGRLYDLGAYPGAVLDARSAGRIFGTVFRLPPGDDVFARLDAYEGFAPDAPRRSLFLRRLHSVQLANGEVVVCWVYEYNGTAADAAMIESGIYRA